MCDMPDVMEDIQNIQKQQDKQNAKIQAILDYLKMGFQYQPESYKVVKPNELTQAMPVGY